DLALALAHRPSILFLDEPTTGLDLQSRGALWNEVARLARDDGVTVFLTTQYLEEADALANRVEDLAGIVRALDAEGIKLENLELHAPSLDDVFLAKTGRSLEGAAEE